MQSIAYLLTLVISLLGLGIIDKKYRLALFWDAKKVLSIMVATLMFFVAWDIGGILAGVFSTNPQWVTGLYIVSPDLPIEEFLFLTLFGYQIILLWRWRCLRISA